MPNIRQYSSAAAEQGGFRPDQSGVDTLVSSARNLSNMAYDRGRMIENTARMREQGFNAIVKGTEALGGSVLKAAETYVSHKEVMRFSADMADVTNTVVKQWNDTRANADLNDPSVASKFNEDTLQPMLEKFINGYSTQEGQERAAQAAGRLTEHIQGIQASDTAHMAGEAAVQNLTLAANRNADTLVSDPTSLPFINESTNAMIADARKNPLLNAEQQAHIEALGTHLREQNTKAAFHGMAEKNPAAAKAALEAGFGKDDLSAEARIELGRVAEAQIKMAEADKKRDRVFQKDENNQASHQVAAQLIGSMIQDDGVIRIGPEFFPGVKKLASMPDVAPGLVESTLNLGIAITNKVPGTNDSATMEDFNTRMLLPPDDPKALSLAEVYDARTHGKLSDEGLSLYHGAVTTLTKDPEKRIALGMFKEFVASQKSTITGSNPLLNKSFPEQDRKFGEFQFNKRKQFEQAYKDGTWRQVLDKQSPLFLGNDTANYATSTKAGLQLYLGSIQLAPDQKADMDAVAKGEKTAADKKKADMDEMNRQLEVK